MNDELYPVLKGEQRFAEEPASFATINEIRNKPGWLVKKLSKKFHSIESAVADHKAAKEIFFEYFPKFDFVITGKNHNEATGYVMMEEVYKEPHDHNFFEELDNVIEKSCNYFFSNMKKVKKLDSEGSYEYFLGKTLDISEGNFVYGKTISNPQIKLYCIDNQPLVQISPTELISKIESCIKPYQQSYSFEKTKAMILKLKAA